MGSDFALGSRHYLEHDEGVDLSVFWRGHRPRKRHGTFFSFSSEAGKAAGMAVIADPLRPEAKKSSRQCAGLAFRA